MSTLPEAGTAHVERTVPTASGFFALGLALVLLAGGGIVLWSAVHPFDGVRLTIAILLFIGALLALCGLYTLQPNEAAILQLFGAYRGTTRVPGLRATNPFYTRRKISLRARNLNGDRLKVNDKRGNPIEIAAVVVWHVADTAKAAFDVDDYETFVRIQTETAIRHMASEYPYDVYTEGQVSLRANADEVMGVLVTELQSHMTEIGIDVERVQLRRLAYAPEIAADMLRRQQAEAVVAARFRIVEGAVSMVEQALDQLSEKQIVNLDEERKAAMVSNLLVVLCSEHGTQPVVNAGSLYQ